MALFDKLMRRVADRTGELADGIRDGVETGVAQFPDVRVRREGDTLVIEAIGLLRRWVGDARLRFALWRWR